MSLFSGYHSSFATCILALGAALAAVPSATAQGQEDAPALDEGPLRNDTFVPTDRDAEALLERGDQALAQSRAGARAALIQAFDAWRAAIEGSRFGALVEALPRADGDPELEVYVGDLDRRLAAVPVAVLWRLGSLEPDERRAWRERFGPLAEEALSANPYQPRALAKVERLFPGTRAAAIASLRQADLAIESARPARARARLARADHHAALAEFQSAGWQAHLADRRARTKSTAGAAPPTGTDGVDPGGEWKLVRSVRLESRRGSMVPGRRPPLGLGLRPGAAEGQDGDLLVQTARALVWLSADALDSAKGGDARLLPHEDWLDLPPERSFVPPASGGWPLLPLRWNEDFVLVVGRGRPAVQRKDLPVPARGNHLVAASLLDQGALQVRWSLAGPGLERPGVPSRLASEVLGPGTWEFQPGPVRIDDVLVVLARGMPLVQGRDADPDEPPSDGLLRLVGLDWESGELLWRTDLARAADLMGNDGEVVGLGTDTQVASMPLAAAGGCVLVGTHAGILACVDAGDGRAEWLFRNQRRSPDEGSWPGSSRPRIRDGLAWFTPSDSDHLYRLPAGPASPMRPLIQAEPAQPRGNRSLLAHAEKGRELHFGRSGRHRVLGQRNASGDHAILYLGAEERFAGLPASTAHQLLVTTDRSAMVIGLDDLKLEALLPLPDLGAGVGGDWVPFAGGAAILGADTLWVLRHP